MAFASQIEVAISAGFVTVSQGPSHVDGSAAGPAGTSTLDKPLCVSSGLRYRRIDR